MTDLANWMGQIDSDRPLTGLAIPGTHDTMTASCDQRYYRTQEIDLAEQLAIGVRFLDIRLRREMVAAHREWVSEVTAEEIFETVANFLAQHPAETILMRIQNANENKDDFEAYRSALLAKITQYQECFYDFTGGELDADDNPIWPTLAQAAGKIIPLECAPPVFAVNQVNGKIWAAKWHDNPQICLQDLWDGPTVADKQAAISANLEASRKTAKENILFLNHISATNGQLGYPDSYAQELNPWTVSLWESSTVLGTVGVQIYDFVSKEICTGLVSLNQ